MSEKCYTQYEITKMANNIYNRCRGCFNCEHYRPVNYGNKDSKNSTDKLFKCPDNGCFYAAELPWDDTKWCWFFPPKTQMYIDRLWALTWENMTKSAMKKTR